MNGADLPTGVSVKDINQDRVLIEILNNSTTKADILQTTGTVTFQVTNPATSTTDERQLKVSADNLVVGTFAGDKTRFLDW